MTKILKREHPDKIQIRPQPTHQDSLSPHHHSLHALCKRLVVSRACCFPLCKGREPCGDDMSFQFSFFTLLASVEMIMVKRKNGVHGMREREKETKNGVYGMREIEKNGAHGMIGL